MRKPFGASEAEESRAWKVPTLRAIGVTKTDEGVNLPTHIEGRAVPYGVWEDIGGFFLESVTKGAFDKSIQESARNLPLLLWHDSRTWPIGKAVKWESRDDGLYGTWELADTPEAAKAAALAADGFLDGLSVGFVPIRSHWDTAKDDIGDVDRVARTEARLVEVSLVPTPAYADAGVTLVRTAKGRTGSPRRSKVDKWRAWRETV